MCDPKYLEDFDLMLKTPPTKMFFRENGVVKFYTLADYLL